MFLRLRGSTFQNNPSQWKDGAWGEMMGGAFQKHPSYAGGCKCVESKASKLGRRAEISSKRSKPEERTPK